jgi:hypothetical protein
MAPIKNELNAKMIIRKSIVAALSITSCIKSNDPKILGNTYPDKTKIMSGNKHI